MRWRIAVVLIAGGAACAWGLWRFPDRILPPLAKWLDVGTQPQQAELVMVLPGDENTRPFVAAALLNVDLAETAVIPENALPPDAEDGFEIPDHEIIRRVLQHQGVSDDRILTLEGSTRSTYDDALLLRDFLDSRADARTIVVTSEYHTRRARWAFTRVLGPCMRRVRFVSAPNGRFCLKSWWRYEEGFCSVLGEYLKLAGYFIVYGTFIYWATAGLGGCGLWYAWQVTKRARKHRPAGPSDPSSGDARMDSPNQDTTGPAQSPCFGRC